MQYNRFRGNAWHLNKIRISVKILNTSSEEITSMVRRRNAFSCSTLAGMHYYTGRDWKEVASSSL